MKQTWKDLLEQLQVVLCGDDTLTDLVPADAIRLANSGAFVVPCEEYFIVSDNEQEVTTDIRVQFDLYNADLDELASMVARTRELVTRATPFMLGSLPLAWAEYAAGRTLEGAQDGRYSWSFDIVFHVYRSAGDRVH